MSNLIEYRLQRKPDIGTIAGQLYEYVFASNGIFVRGKRAGLEACLPIGESKEVRGLEACKSYRKLEYPRVPADHLRTILEEALAAKDESGQPIEKLFYLSFDGGQWNLTVPEQHQSAASCSPVDPYDLACQNALIEIHSHHGMGAFFSAEDNRDEQGFKIYGVIGKVFTDPVILMRVGLYGYFQVIPTEEIFIGLPPTIRDKAQSHVKWEEEDA